MKDLYKVLQIEKSSTINDIKHAYKKLAFKHHPDKGGTEEKFKEISEAYEILSDDNKRRRYDLGGYESLDSNNSNPMDIFNNLFGGSGMMGGIFNMSDIMGNNMNNMNNRIENIEVTLDDLYIGAKKTVIIDTKHKCNSCLGNGYMENGKILCQGCNGTKMIVQTIQMGPMIQQSRRPCHMCNQQGFTIKQGYECNTCKSTGTIIQKNKYNLNIKKGNVDGKDILLKGKGDYIKELGIQGDLTIKLQEVLHKRFKRKNNDLFIEVSIPLEEALCGTTLKLEHLNDKYIYLNIDKIIKPDYIMKIDKKGMPLLTDNGIIYGNLLVLFKIIFPTKFSNDIKNSLKSLFKVVDRYSDNESLNIEYYKKVDEIDEEEQGGVQCVQQ